MQGRKEEGIAQLRQGAVVMQRAGFVLRLEQYAQLAEAHGRSGQTAMGLQVLAEALEARDHSLECWYEAELHRLKGVMLLQDAAMLWNAAEACFHQALYTARRDHAKLLELRAAVSLSRLWQQQGKRDQAYTLLLEVYSWFTEGFDTQDLQEAKAQLEALGRVRR